MTKREDETLAAVREIAHSGTVRMAAVEGIECYPTECDEICDMLERVLNIRVGFLSDKSSLSDFRGRHEPADEAYYTKLSVGLGVPVTKDDSVLEVCRRLREQARAGRS